MIACLEACMHMIDGPKVAASDARSGGQKQQCPLLDLSGSMETVLAIRSASQCFIWRDGACWGDSVSARCGKGRALEAICRDKTPIGLATLSVSDLGLKVLDQLDARQYFSKMVFGDMVERHKPAPDIYLETMRRMGVSASACLAIEDSYSGVSAATNAKLLTIHVRKEPHRRFWRASSGGPYWKHGRFGYRLVLDRWNRWICR